MESASYNASGLKGRNRRLLLEWQKIEQLCAKNDALEIEITERNSAGLPVSYTVDFSIRSFCSVENMDRLECAEVGHRPVFADRFKMRIDIPEGFPDIDSQPSFRFLDKDSEGNALPTPWHPNIRFFGPMKGTVCLNRADSFTDIAYAIDRVSRYLTYELYHASNRPPFPEDLKVARWVEEHAEKNGWLNF